MDSYQTLYEIAKLLLSEDDSERTAEILLRRLLAATGAERGFIVVREGDSYAQKFDVGFDGRQVSKEQRRFSRSLVYQVLKTQELTYSPNLRTDPRFASADSVLDMGDCAVLVAPLRHDGQVWGVVYLERLGSVESFSDAARQLVTEFVDLAGLSLHKALERDRDRERSRVLERDLFARHNFEGIVARDAKMIELLKLVAQVADSDATVLVLGETGTGKELVARALHVNSPRRSRPFVTLHCTALPVSILESELFGHVKGAFTGAERDRAGRIASAAGGTLFLDEVAELSAELQAKLLRFLQFGEIQRVGSDRVEKLDVRIVAATHQDLRALVQAGRFRQDLFFRLDVIELEIPPLRERRSDIPLLLDRFMTQSWRRGGETPRWTRPAQQVLEAYDYPGNVRELENLVARACVLAPGPELGVELLPASMRQVAPSEPSRFEKFTNEELKAAREAAQTEVEGQFIAGLLERCGGNVSQAARESGIHRSYLQKLVTEHRITASTPQEPGGLPPEP